jgi:hypothetical protein
VPPGRSAALSAARLAEGGWEVVAAARGNRPSLPGTRLVRVDRQRVGALQRAVGDGVDEEIEGEQIDPGLVVSLTCAECEECEFTRTVSRGRTRSRPEAPYLRVDLFSDQGWRLKASARSCPLRDSPGGSYGRFWRLPGTAAELEAPNRLHTHRILELVRVGPTEKAAICAAFAKPSDGLEPSTPSLRCSGRNRSQPVATVLACWRRFRGLPICHRLPLVATARLQTLHPLGGMPDG